MLLCPVVAVQELKCVILAAVAFKCPPTSCVKLVPWSAECLHVFAPPFSLIEELRSLISKEHPSPGCLGLNERKKQKLADTRPGVSNSFHRGPSVYWFLVFP